MDENKWPTIYRTEVHHSNSTDFWDFTDKTVAEEFGKNMDPLATVRELSEEELQDTATIVYIERSKEDTERLKGN